MCSWVSGRTRVVHRDRRRGTAYAGAGCDSSDVGAGHLGALFSERPRRRAVPDGPDRRDDARLPPPDRQPGDRFIAFPPDEPADAEAIAAGSWLPGWQVSFVPLDAAARRTAQARRRTTYVATGLASVALIILVGAAVGQTTRRYLQVARLKTDLVAAASHELRTPLASMRVLLDGLLADAEIDPVKTREYLEPLSVENARLTRLIENFLTFSRLDRGRAPFVFDDTSAASIRDGRRRSRPAPVAALGRRAARDRVGYSDDRRRAGAHDGTRQPARKRYQVRSTSDPRIEIRAAADDGYVKFAVTDHGIGIAPGQQRRIFRRFYRVDQALSRQTGGVGLGLSIVESIVRGHGGTIEVASAPGQGSTFTIRVPLMRRTIAT